jgi:ABC-type dipeptide/oligopeptide/nickel transport system permease subunit
MPSGIQRAIEASRLSMVTIYKLTIGGAILVLLLLSLLPTPHDPQFQRLNEVLAFPLVSAGGHVLGADQLGRDVLSRLMVGGRALLFRLAIVGLLLTGAGLVVRRRISRRTGKLWPATPLLVLLVTLGMALSVLSELLLAMFADADRLHLLGPVGRILLGVAAPPPGVTWGGMLATSRAFGVQAPWLPVFPFVGLGLVAVGLVLLGSGISDVLKQRART